MDVVLKVHVCLVGHQFQYDQACMILSWKMGGLTMHSGKEVDRPHINRLQALLITCRVCVTQ